MSEIGDITYRGDVEGAQLLVRDLEARGVDVEWTAPEGPSSDINVIHEVLIPIVAMGSYDAIKAAVKAAVASGKGRDAKVRKRKR